MPPRIEQWRREALQVMGKHIRLVPLLHLATGISETSIARILRDMDGPGIVQPPMPSLERRVELSQLVFGLYPEIGAGTLKDVFELGDEGDEWRREALQVMMKHITLVPWLHKATGISERSIKEVLQSMNNPGVAQPPLPPLQRRLELARMVYGLYSEIGVGTLKGVFELGDNTLQDLGQSRAVQPSAPPAPSLLESRVQVPSPHPTVNELIGLKSVKKDLKFAFADSSGMQRLCLHGPSGTGKTTTVNSFALEHDFKMLKVRALDVNDSAMIENIFNYVRTSGLKIIVLFDDSLDEAFISTTSDALKMRKKIVEELNKPLPPNAKVIATTNYYRNWDSAGHSRFKGIFVDKPQIEDLKELMKLFFQGFNGADSLDWEIIAPMANGLTSRYLQAVRKEAERICWESAGEPPTVDVSTAQMKIEAKVVVEAVQKVLNQ